MKEVTSTELREIEVNGIALSYTEQGEGEPLILVHGNLCDYRMWEGQLGPFSEKYRVIAYSRRYAYPAKTTDDKTGYTVTPHADDLAALVKRLNLTQVHLVGHSFGAYTALLTAIEHPELVKSLCLAEPPVASLLVTSEEGNRLLFEWVTQTVLPSAQAFESGDDLEGVKIFLDGIMADTGFYDKMTPEVKQQINENIQEMKGIICSKMIFEFNPFITCADIRNVRAPTLLITAEKSPRFLHVISDELEKCLSQQERVMIPQSSHEMELDNPQALNEAILRFLARHTAHS